MEPSQEGERGGWAKRRRKAWARFQDWCMLKRRIKRKILMEHIDEALVNYTKKESWLCIDPVRR